MHRLVLNVPGDLREPAVSPSGELLAFTATHYGIRHVWIEEMVTRNSREVTGGACNSYAAAWEPDSRHLVFASDCGRGLGLPRLYRTALAELRR
jgi:Tol biopolymer transport system component